MWSGDKDEDEYEDGADEFDFDFLNGHNFFYAGFDLCIQITFEKNKNAFNIVSSILVSISNKFMCNFGYYLFLWFQSCLQNENESNKKNMK